MSIIEWAVMVLALMIFAVGAGAAITSIAIGEDKQ